MARGEAGESSAQQGGEGVLVSRQVRLLGSHTVCVTLWYAIVGDDASVHVKTYDADGVVSSDHWSDDSTTDGLWIQTRLTLVSDGPFQVLCIAIFAFSEPILDTRPEFVFLIESILYTIFVLL